MSSHSPTRTPSSAMGFEALSIRQLYTLALAEGEGVGTAYEYFAKRLVLLPWLKQIRPKTILIAGLPQTYGASLDFVQLAYECGASVVALDERQKALDRLTDAVAAVQAQGWWPGLMVQTRLVADIAEPTALVGPFDWAVCSEVVQRVSAEKRPAFVHTLTQLAHHVAIFCPNKDNAAHVGHSGLDGLFLWDLQALFDAPLARAGYIDMPPFPPGITRSDDQREQATSGRLEAFAMWGLQQYARGERLLPRALRQRQSHIVYALANG